jgi:hypothetical protein
MAQEKQEQDYENPYVYSRHPHAMYANTNSSPDGMVHERTQAEAWQQTNQPVGKTAQQIYEESKEQMAWQDANAASSQGGKKHRRNKKSKRILRNVKAKSQKNRKSRARRRRSHMSRR